LIRRKERATTHVLTVPLIVDKTTGKKFGKSEGNAIWLDAEKTSPYQFYQFWLNTADENVLDYIQLYTLLTLEEIEDLKQRFELDPGAREAQKTLAFKVTEIVHGTNTANVVRQASEIVFGGGAVLDVDDDLRNIVLENAPTHTITKGTLLVDLLVDAELASSKREARTFIASGAIKLNGVAVTDAEYTITNSEFKNNLLPVSRGKKRFTILVWE
jgi:tyrosyl-tRNA synthetase